VFFNKLVKKTFTAIILYMILDHENLWKNALVEIELSLSKANFVTWFKGTRISEYENGIIFLDVPNGFVKEWLSTKYHKFIINALRNINAEIRNVEYIINTLPPKQQEIKEEVLKISAIIDEDQPGFKEFYVDSEFNLNPKYTFDSYIVAPFNEVAHSAALAVTKNLGTLYNPLFIYGGVGLGKTHLLQAIGNKLKEENPALKIFYLTSEKFANEFIYSIETKSIHTFKEKYRKYNLLIVDDIQFFSGKLKIQEEFFHIFNSLYDKNNQIVFSSDRPPKHITGLEDRLRSRFEGGMMVDVSEPEFESRLAILKIKAERKGAFLEDGVLEFIASSVKENIRELEGALNSVIGQTKLRGQNLSLNEVKEILKKNIEPIKTLTITQIIKTISDFYHIDEKSLFEKTRRKEIVKPRQVAMYLLREDLNTSYPYIGSKFGQRDHTTVIHAYKKINAEIKQDERLCQELKEIRELLYKNSG